MTVINEYINHYNAVRLRVKGNGDLKLTLLSPDEIYSQELVPVSMVLTTARNPTQLANFKQLRAKLRIETTEMNETFQISHILVFSKPVEGSFPQ